MHVSRTCCKRSKSQPTKVKSTDSKSTVRFFSSRSPSKRLRKLVSTESREGDCWLKLTSTVNNLKHAEHGQLTCISDFVFSARLILPKVPMLEIITTNFQKVNIFIITTMNVKKHLGKSHTFLGGRYTSGQKKRTLSGHWTKIHPTRAYFHRHSREEHQLSCAFEVNHVHTGS